MALCNDVGVCVGPAKTCGLWVIPLFSWYDLTFDDDSSARFPELEGWADYYLCEWPPEVGSVVDYFFGLNEPNIKSYDGSVITFMLSEDAGKPLSTFDMVAEVLNKLRDDLNEAFGVSGVIPRINKGACGPFAALFLEIWNRLFLLPCRICFLIDSNDSDYCLHCFVQLPDGRFFDGGFGVFTRDRVEAFIARYFGAGRMVIEVLDQYDDDLLDRRSYGRIKSGVPIGQGCAEYSGDLARALVERRLQELARVSPDGLCCTNLNEKLWTKVMW